VTSRISTIQSLNKPNYLSKQKATQPLLMAPLGRGYTQTNREWIRLEELKQNQNEKTRAVTTI